MELRRFASQLGFTSLGWDQQQSAMKILGHLLTEPHEDQYNLWV